MPVLTTNLPIANIEDTIKYFETLYDQPIQISQEVMDVVYGFFINKADNSGAALALVHSVLVTAIKLGVDPLEVIEEFNKHDGLKLNKKLTSFLNMSRGNTSMIGMSSAPLVSYHIARTLLP